MYVISRPLPRYLLGILFMPMNPPRSGHKRRSIAPLYRNVTGSRPVASARPSSTSAAARTLGSVLS